MHARRLRWLQRQLRPQDYDVYARRPDRFQLINPYCHPDGDMVEIYLDDTPLRPNHVRIRDYGLTWMRLSCHADTDDPAQSIRFRQLLQDHGIDCYDAEMRLDVPEKELAVALSRFAECALRICAPQTPPGNG